MNRGEKPVFKSKKTLREEELVKSYETLKVRFAGLVIYSLNIYKGQPFSSNVWSSSVLLETDLISDSPANLSPDIQSWPDVWSVGYLASLNTVYLVSEHISKIYPSCRMSCKVEY